MQPAVQASADGSTSICISTVEDDDGNLIRRIPTLIRYRRMFRAGMPPEQFFLRVDIAKLCLGQSYLQVKIFRSNTPPARYPTDQEYRAARRPNTDLEMHPLTSISQPNEFNDLMNDSFDTNNVSPRAESRHDNEAEGAEAGIPRPPV
jgi:hypothetical protein